MKKLFSLAMLLVALIGISACSETNFIDPEIDPGVNPVTNTVAVDLSKEEDVIAVSALSSAFELRSLE